MKFLNFFLLFWVIFALLDPDPLTRLNPDPIRIRIRIRNPASYTTTELQATVPVPTCLTLRMSIRSSTLFVNIHWGK